jgi:hypothetical protein
MTKLAWTIWVIGTGLTLATLLLWIFQYFNVKRKRKAYILRKGILWSVGVLILVYIFGLVFIVGEKQKPLKPEEFQMTLYPPKNSESEQNEWLLHLESFLRKHSYKAFIWKYKGKKCLDLVGLKEGNKSVYYTRNLLEKNGFLDGGTKIEVGKISGRNDTYKLYLYIEKKIIDKEITNELWVWVESVEKLLESNNYVIYEDNEDRINRGNKDHLPTVFSISYPPWREAFKIRELIKDSGLDPPTLYRICEEDPLALHMYFLTGIETSQYGVKINAFIPMKWDDYYDYEQQAQFTIRVIGPRGKVYICSSTQNIHEFKKVFPNDFKPLEYTPELGKYKVYMYIDVIYDNYVESFKLGSYVFKLNKDGYTYCHESIIYCTQFIPFTEGPN